MSMPRFLKAVEPPPSEGEKYEPVQVPTEEVDGEVAALNEMVRQLDCLSEQARARCFAYLYMRYGGEPGK